MISGFGYVPSKSPPAGPEGAAVPAVVANVAFAAFAAFAALYAKSDENAYGVVVIFIRGIFTP